MDKILNMYFSPQGRIGRLSYFLYYLVLVGIYALLSLGFVDLISKGTTPEFFTSDMEIVFVVFLSLILLVLFYASFMLGIKRFHDLDQSGWWMLLFFIPFVNLCVAIYLLFFKGTPGVNRFGNPPV